MLIIGFYGINQIRDEVSTAFLVHLDVRHGGIDTLFLGDGVILKAVYTEDASQDDSENTGCDNE